jgi:hypothetical protein
LEVTPQQAETIQVLMMAAVLAETLLALVGAEVLAGILEMAVLALLVQAVVKLDPEGVDPVVDGEAPELLVVAAVVA